MLPATLFIPTFLTQDKRELHQLLNVLRDPLCTHLYGVLLAHSDFDRGTVSTSYAALRVYTTPPAPERGKRLPAPTLKQVRRAIDWLIEAGLVKRDAEENAAQGILKLRVRPRTKKRASKTKEGRV